MTQMIFVCEAAGAARDRPDCNPKQAHGWMYGRSFEDPDGHIWAPNWMDMAAALAAEPAEHAA